MVLQVTKKNIITSIIWKFLELGGTQIVLFVVQIILARLLLPENYGSVALLTVFIAISGVIVQSGLNTALIQKKDTDEQDFSTVFYLNISAACVLYITLFFIAPVIARFYKQPVLSDLLRVLALTLFLGAVNSTQYAALTRKMQFKKLFFISLAAIMLSGSAGIAMAYKKFGVWALVGQQIISQLTTTVLLWFLVKWRPKPIFSFQRLKSLFQYSGKLLCSALMDAVYNNVYSLVIGKVYDPTTLGYYNRGDQLPNLIVANIDGSITNVMFPALSFNQDDKARVKAMMRRSIVTSSFVIFPLMVGLMVTAQSLVKILLTDKWLPCVPYMQILCISYMFWPVQTANLQAINAVGRSDIFLRLEIIKKIVGVSALCVGIPFGIYIMVLLRLFVSIAGMVINSFPNKKLFGYGYLEQLKDFMPSLLLAAAMGGVIYLISLLGLAIWPSLILQIVIGIVFYCGVAHLIKLECFTYLLRTVKDMLVNSNDKKLKNSALS